MTQGVLCCGPDGGAFRYHTRGIGRAFEAIGIPFADWDGQNIELIRQLQPRIYIACSEAWRWNYPAWARHEYGTKVLIHVNPYGTVKVGSIDRGPIIDAKPRDIKWVAAQRPDGVFCYADRRTVDTYFNSWRSQHSYKIYPFSLAADHCALSGAEYRDELAFDVGWVGGIWPYKAVMMNKYLIPLRQKHRCGFYGWNDPWRMGPISDQDVKHLYRSAKICPSVSESHTVHHPIDMPQRVYNVACAGGFTIHTPTPCLERLGLSDVIPMAHNEAEWFDMIQYYLDHDEERMERAARQKEAILRNHTYLHRITDWVKDFFPEKLTELEQAQSSLLASDAPQSFGAIAERPI